MNRHEKGQKVLNDVFGGKMSASGPAFTDMVEITTDYLFGFLEKFGRGLG